MNITLLALLGLLGALAVNAQSLPARSILFNRYLQAGQKLDQQLAAVNPDGTGELQVGVDLPEVGFPTWSRDGRLLALSSVDPATPFGISRNVFVVDMRSSQVTKITRFADKAGSGSGAGQGSATVSACVLPWHKAFSPDNTRIAISALEYSGISWAYADPDQPDDPYGLYSGFKATPVLQIYSLADGMPGALVAMGGSGTDTIHTGDGVDWSPVDELLVFPKDKTLRVVDPVGQVFYMPITALMLMPPVNDAVGVGKARQLTYPNASVSYSWSGPVSIWETDFQPAFSPDGQWVAYVRSVNAMVGGSIQRQTHSLRMVNLDGSNDRQLAQFELGEYVSHVTWSPDGKTVAFDRAQQASSSGGIPMCMPQTASSSIWTVGADGGGLTKLRDKVAAWPAWYPGAAAPPAAPRLEGSLVRQAGRPPKINLAWPAAAGNVALQSSASVGTQALWKAETAQPAAVGDQLSVTLDVGAGTKFFRLAR